jgi:1-acyl-sn-glycerol-3-phosphate acyltransferase
MTKTARFLEPWDDTPPRMGERLPPTDPQSPSYWIDPPFLQAFSESMVRPFADRYFRAEVHGLAHLPRARPALVAMNHSGMGWPWDAIIFMHRIPAHMGYERPWFVRGFALPYFFMLPGLGPLVLRTGMYPATFRNLDRLLCEGELLLYYPEGAEGIGKGWSKRYALQPFHTSFVKNAVKWGAPVVPTVCIGAEELNPLAHNASSLAKLTGIPIFPVSPLQLALFPTWLTSAMFVLPSRLRYHVGPPLRFRIDPARAGEDDYRTAAEELRAVMQGMIDEHRATPPEPALPPPPAASPWTYPWTAKDRALAALPFGWPLLYLRFWNAWHAAHGSPPPGKPAYAPHERSEADQLALLWPWAWTLPIARHRRALFADPLGIRSAFGLGGAEPRPVQAPLAHGDAIP